MNPEDDPPFELREDYVAEPGAADIGWREVLFVEEAFSHEKSREIILGGAGGQFSPQAVRAFEMAEAKIVEVYERLRD